MFRAKGHKLSRFLGQLETDIMEILWRQSPLSAKEVRLQLRLKKKLAPTTVLTVLSRLVEKECLSRSSIGRSNVFSPMCDRDTFVRNHVQALLQNLQEEFPNEFKSVMEKLSK